MLKAHVRARERTVYGEVSWSGGGVGFHTDDTHARTSRNTYVIGDENIERSGLTEDTHFIDGSDHGVEDFAFERSEDECLVLDVEGGVGSHSVDRALRAYIHRQTDMSTQP